MDKDFILDLIKKHPSNFWKLLKFNHREFFDQVCLINGFSFSEKLYIWLNGEGKSCLVCDKPTKFAGINNGYYECCSKKCGNILKFKNYTSKMGVENVSQLNHIKEKKKETFLKKYGVKSPFNMKCNVKKRNLTFEEKYGGQPFNNKIIHKKATISKLKNFVDQCRSVDRLGENLEALFDYNFYKEGDNKKKLPFKCKICGHEFTSHFQWCNVPKCKICNPTSKFEKDVCEFLIKDLGLKIKTNVFGFIENREIDIIIDDLKVCIELDGVYWHGEVNGNKRRFYHVQKTNMVEKLGYKLIHIFEDEWEFKKDLVKSRLTRILNKDVSQKLYARKCEIKKISNEEKNEFLNKNHIQGKDSSSIKLGAFINNELVSIMTFGKLRVALGNKNQNENEYELYRFCSSKNVIGVASKLLSYFIKKYNPNKIITYCDRRWSDSNNFYKKLGFEYIKTCPPNYWYIINSKRFHRFNYRKNVLQSKLENFNPLLSEWENMKNNGYDRIWDCGSFKYEMKLK